MNETLQTAIDEGLAALARVTATPVAPLGYGADVSCTTDVDPTLALVDPFSYEGIAQGMVRCWDCPRGSLANDGKDAAAYGISLREHVNRGATRRDLNALQARLEAEALKDPRVDRIKVDAAVTFSGAEVSLRIVATIRPKSSIGPFQLVLAVTSETIVIESIQAVAA